jgi:hypothetical protein
MARRKQPGNRSVKRGRSRSSNLEIRKTGNAINARFTGYGRLVLGRRGPWWKEACVHDSVCGRAGSLAAACAGARCPPGARSPCVIPDRSQAAAVSPARRWRAGRNTPSRRPNHRGSPNSGRLDSPAVPWARRAPARHGVERWTFSTLHAITVPRAVTKSGGVETGDRISKSGNGESARFASLPNFLLSGIQDPVC